MSNGDTSNAVLAFVKKRPGELAAASMSVIAVGAVVAALTVTSGHGASDAAPVESIAVPESASASYSTASSTDVVNLHMLAQPLASLPSERVGAEEKTALEAGLKQVKDALSATPTVPGDLQSAYTTLQNAVGGMATSTLKLGREHRLQVTLANVDILTAYDAALIELGDAGDDRARTSGISAVVRQATAAQTSHTAAVDSQQGDTSTVPEPPVDESEDVTPPQPPQAPEPSDPVSPVYTIEPVPDGGTVPSGPGETITPPEPPAPVPTDEPADPEPTEDPEPSSGSDLPE